MRNFKSSELNFAIDDYGFQCHDRLFVSFGEKPQSEPPFHWACVVHGRRIGRLPDYGTTRFQISSSSACWVERYDPAERGVQWSMSSDLPNEAEICTALTLFGHHKTSGPDGLLSALFEDAR